MEGLEDLHLGPASGKCRTFTCSTGTCRHASLGSSPWNYRQILSHFSEGPTSSIPGKGVHQNVFHLLFPFFHKVPILSNLTTTYSIDSKVWQDKARNALQRYIDVVLEDAELNKTELIYSFLSPTPEHLTLPVTATAMVSSSASAEKTNVSRQGGEKKLGSSISNFFQNQSSTSSGNTTNR